MKVSIPLHLLIKRYMSGRKEGRMNGRRTKKKEKRKHVKIQSERAFVRLHPVLPSCIGAKLFLEPDQIACQLIQQIKARDCRRILLGVA